MVTQRDSQANVRISEAVRSDSAAMKTVAVLTLVFLPATFVSVSQWRRGPNYLVMLAYPSAGHFQHPVLQFYARDSVRTRFMGNFGPLLDLLGILCSPHYSYSRVLVGMATLVSPSLGGDPRKSLLKRYHPQAYSSHRDSRGSGRARNDADFSREPAFGREMMKCSLMDYAEHGKRRS